MEYNNKNQFKAAAQIRNAASGEAKGTMDATCLLLLFRMINDDKDG